MLGYFERARIYYAKNPQDDPLPAFRAERRAAKETKAALAAPGAKVRMGRYEEAGPIILEVVDESGAVIAACPAQLLER